MHIYRKKAWLVFSSKLTQIDAVKQSSKPIFFIKKVYLYLTWYSYYSTHLAFPNLTFRSSLKVLIYRTCTFFHTMCTMLSSNCSFEMIQWWIVYIPLKDTHLNKNRIFWDKLFTTISRSANAWATSGKDPLFVHYKHKLCKIKELWSQLKYTSCSLVSARWVKG